MGRITFWSIGAWLAVGAVSWGQPVGIMPEFQTVPPGMVGQPFEPVVGGCPDCGSAEPVFCCDEGCACNPAKVWVRAEYLMWWLRGMYVPPLITSSPSEDVPARRAGELNRRNTDLVFGNTTIDEGLRQGGRVSTGFWLGPDLDFGIEGHFLFLAKTGSTFLATTVGDADDTFLARPFFNARNDTQDRVLVGVPENLEGSIEVVSSSQLFGGGVLGFTSLARGPGWRVDFLGGYRYLNLREQLQINQAQVALVDLEDVPEGTELHVSDIFRTSTQFHGEEIGLRLHVCKGRLFAELTGKLAFGFNFRRADLRGGTWSMEPEAEDAVTFNRGILVQRTNRGGQRDSEFAIVPELALNCGCQLTSHWRAYVGYSFLYWTDVTRPGDQVNLVLNPRLFPPNRGVTEPLQPDFDFTQVDFWAHGVNFGLEFRY